MPSDQPVELHRPTYKWMAGLVASVGAYMNALINTGWDLTPTLQVMLVGLVVQAVVSYLAPSTAPKRRRRRRRATQAHARAADHLVTP